MNKHHPHPYLSLLALTLCLSCCSLLFAQFNRPPTANEPTADVSSPSRILRVVLDAGHGGEDGGASAPNGTLEKDLNLAVTLLLRDMLVANGIEVVLTRETDTLLYDRNVDYHGRKKALDFAERLRIAEACTDSVFVSIHMNTYPRADCSGLQVWYSPNHAASYPLAKHLQESATSLLQPENNRDVKASGSQIYLLHHLKSPAVLVECGFLSNPTEARRLCDADYQKQLAFSLFLAITQAALEI